MNRAAFSLIFLCLPVVQSHSQDGVSREARSGFTVSKPVLTTSGLVHGHPAPNAVDISEYLGIPYAQPPVGELRFSPPVHYRSFGALNGSAFGFMCPQPSSAIRYGTLNLTDNVVDILNGLGALPNEQSEDCLTINVWTKSPGIGRNRPVMLWTHGGGFLTGGSALPVYTGQKWAEDEDVVFMSFNYRMGVLGFPGGPGLTQNVALLDHRMAVEWARNNAAAFGGDRIYIWRADPIISGMIGQSGAASSLIVADPETQVQAWYNLTTAVGCGNTTTQSAAKVVACMRDSGQVSAQDLVEATIKLAPGPFDAILGPFRPTIDNETIFSDYARRDRDGLFIRKPVLIGSNDNEGVSLTRKRNHGTLGRRWKPTIYTSHLIMDCANILIPRRNTLL
nr:cholinesterase [Quercus suber]